jgi:hypothetical protein
LFNKINLRRFAKSNQKQNKMTKEIVTTWVSTKHPENPNFMQKVKYLHIQYPDGRNNLHWRLCNSALYDHYLIKDISLNEAQIMYKDDKEAITEEEYQKWLQKK